MQVSKSSSKSKKSEKKEEEGCKEQKLRKGKKWGENRSKGLKAGKLCESAEQDWRENRCEKVKCGKIMQGEGVRNRKGERIEVKG
jgi:hypothetical protein